MCCILTCFSTRASFNLISDASMMNSDGIGVAWINRRVGAVQWEKGLTAAKAHEITQNVPFPYMIHARMATVGGKDPVLTHPFPVSFKPSLSLAGAAKRVLMHNGHLAEWKDMARMIGLQLPKNPRGWSDSRVIASAVHTVGTEVLKMLEGNRFALLSVDKGMELFGNWSKVEDGIMASSDPRPRYVSYGKYFSHMDYYGRDICEDGTYEDAVRLGMARTKDDARTRDEIAYQQALEEYQSESSMPSWKGNRPWDTDD